MSFIVSKHTRHVLKCFYRGEVFPYMKLIVDIHHHQEFRASHIRQKIAKYFAQDLCSKYFGHLLIYFFVKSGILFFIIEMLEDPH